MTIKVLVVDDSALIRQVLSTIIQSADDMTLVGTASDAFAAKDMVNKFSPDVITLDIEMPKVDGLTFLDKLMKARPTPVVMMSTLTEAGSDATLKALSLGAVDFIAKPKMNIAKRIEAFQDLLLEKLRVAAKAKIRLYQRTAKSVVPQTGHYHSQAIIAIGASTGGTEAISQVLAGLPGNSPGVVITQHMPPGFTTTFARRLDNMSALKVTEAQGGEVIKPGYAYLAPGGAHLSVEKKGANYVTQLLDTDNVSGHKPSVDVLFNSLARCAGHNVSAAILTGMGKDGAKGMASLRQAGAHTIAQNEQTCVVFGMPKEAIKLDAVIDILPLNEICYGLLDSVKTN